MRPKKKRTATATAAPKATTRLEVTVTDVDTNLPLDGATVKMLGGSVKHPSVKTDKKGVWLSNAVGPGKYSIVVTLKHFGAPVVQPAAPSPPVFPSVGAVTVSQTIAANAPPILMTPVKAQMMRAESTVKLPVVDESYSNVLLFGAKVKVGTAAEVETAGPGLGRWRTASC
jgi:hypothetical protein